LKRHANKKNIDISFCIGLPQVCDLATEDQSVRKNGTTFLQNLAGAIGEMGGGKLGCIIYGTSPASMPEG